MRQFLVILLAISLAGYASAKGAKGEGEGNGQPFYQLQAQVDELQMQVEEDLLATLAAVQALADEQEDLAEAVAENENGVMILTADLALAVSQLLSQIDALDARITAIEDGEEPEETRTFTVTEDSSADDLSLAHVQAALASLDFETGDFLRIEATNPVSARNVDFCITGPVVASVIDIYVNNGTSPPGNQQVASGNAFYFDSAAGWQALPAGTNPAPYFDFEVHDRGKFYFHAWGEGNAGIFPLNSNSVEVYAWGWGDANVVTFTAAATRLDACGF